MKTERNPTIANLAMVEFYKSHRPHRQLYRPKQDPLVRWPLVFTGVAVVLLIVTIGAALLMEFFNVLVRVAA